MEHQTICRHCKVRDADICDSSAKNSDGTRRKYYSCNQCNTERIKKYRKKNPSKIVEITKNYYEKNKEKRRAWNKINNSIRDCKLLKPDKCSVCDKKARLDAHHHDYNKPMEVVWLCRKCHKQEHKDVE